MWFCKISWFLQGPVYKRLQIFELQHILAVSPCLHYSYISLIQYLMLVKIWIFAWIKMNVPFILAFCGNCTITRDTSFKLPVRISLHTKFLKFFVSIKWRKILSEKCLKCLVLLHHTFYYLFNSLFDWKSLFPGPEFFFSFPFLFFWVEQFCYSLLSSQSRSLVVTVSRS